jgi:diguanylate cyclase (GGDEF)-like protein/PAS domain S-box-containing protein
MHISRFSSLSFRITLLLLLFVLFAGSFSFVNQARLARQHIETSELDKMSQRMNRLQGTVEYLLNADDVERIREEIASLGHDEALKHAMLINDAGRIVASLQRSHINEPSTLVFGDNGINWQNKVEELIARSMAGIDGQLLLTADNSSVMGVYPILFKAHDNELRSTRYGALLVERDLAADKSFATKHEAYHLVGFAVVLVVLAAALAIAAHYLVTRRVHHLVQCTKNFAAGDLHVRARLTGEDEISVIGQAFNNMAQTVAVSQQQLIDSEQKVRLLLESTKEAIFAIDLDGRCTFCNPATAELLGYSSLTDLSGRPLLELLYPLGIPESPVFDSALMYSRFTRGHSMLTGEMTLIRTDESKLCTEYRAYPIFRDEALSGAVLSFSDISERKKAELDRSLAASVFEHSNDGIVITDANRNMLRVNDAFERITGYNADEAIGKTPKELLQSHHHDEAFYSQVWASIIESGSWQGEIWDRRKNGEIFPTWQSISVVRDDHGTVDKYISIFSDITERKLVEQHIERLAYYDALTEVPNRLLFNDRLENALIRAGRRGTRVALLFIDLDRFKNINDTLGHPVGDRLLQEVARRLKSCVRKENTVARLGGDEFTVILEDISDEHIALSIANKIVEAMSASFEFSTYSLIAGASIGVSLFPEDGDNCETLIKNADTAMYEAKALGRNRCVRYTAEHSISAEKHFLLERDLRLALERDELVVHYQPQVSADGAIKGAEALVRWQHPGGQLVPPREFLHVAKEIGLLGKLDRYVLFAACRQIIEWQNRGFQSIRIAVNLSGIPINDGSVVDMVKEAVAETGLDAAMLELEITEECIMSNPERIISNLHRLRELGVTLAIDDFGTGHSSLGYLKRLPVNRLKIDRSFVRDITTDKDDHTIIAAIVSMTHHLKLELIAEGVETDQHLAVLNKLGCNEFQGNYFSQPVAADAFEIFFATNSQTALKRQSS